MLVLALFNFSEILEKFALSIDLLKCCYKPSINCSLQKLLFLFLTREIACFFWELSSLILEGSWPSQILVLFVI